MTTSHKFLDCDMMKGSGEPVYYKDPTQTRILLEDLEVGTKNLCRYNGGIPWPLIKHLALCGELAELYAPGDSIAKCHAVSHDLHEIYVGDVIHGLKKHVPQYAEIEDSWEEYVHDYLGLPSLAMRNNALIGFIDRRALVLEMAFHGHKGLYIVEHKFGGEATALEGQVMTRVMTWTVDQCWNKVLAVLEASQNEMKEG